MKNLERIPNVDDRMFEILLEINKTEIRNSQIFENGQFAISSFQKTVFFKNTCFNKDDAWSCPETDGVIIIPESEFLLLAERNGGFLLFHQDKFIQQWISWIGIDKDGNVLVEKSRSSLFLYNSDGQLVQDRQEIENIEKQKVDFNASVEYEKFERNEFYRDEFVHLQIVAEEFSNNWSSVKSDTKVHLIKSDFIFLHYMDRIQEISKNVFLIDYLGFVFFIDMNVSVHVYKIIIKKLSENIILNERQKRFLFYFEIFIKQILA